ncbi:MAG: hypothetical protein AAFX08_02895 [Pseudomonadota bacterium]
MTQEPLDALLGYAAALYSEADGAPIDHARRQGWVDDDGQITKAGKDALKALSEQKGTRSAFRIG